MERTGGRSDARQVCMNVRCGKSTGTNFKDGWYLRSGRPCELCEPCGTVHEQGRFCEVFHYDDAGWRTCNSCKKRVHCGCIVSLHSFVLLDTGGVECQACAKNGVSPASTMVPQPLKPAQHVAPAPILKPSEAPGALLGAWGREPFGSRVLRPGELGAGWRQLPSAFHAPISKNSGVGSLSGPQQCSEVVLRNAAAAGPDGNVNEAAAAAATRGGEGRLHPLLPTEESLSRGEDKNRFISAAAKESPISAERLGDSTDDDHQQIADSRSSPATAGRAAVPGGGRPESGQGEYDREAIAMQPVAAGVGAARQPQLILLSSGLESSDVVNNFGKAATESTAGHALAAAGAGGKSGLFSVQAHHHAGRGPSTGLSMAIGAVTPSKKGSGLEDNSQKQQQHVNGGGAAQQVGLLNDNLAGANSPGVSGESKDLVAKISGGGSSHRSRQRQLLPRPFPPTTPTAPGASASNTNTNTNTNNVDAKSGNDPGSIRVARPPGQGRGRNQLLPRYWPRITDQELQQITSGDSNSTITPLFEKMLSASDAGRIGRLVLPKACAEAYFPPISQPEGLPMKIQDVTGKEWMFQFRFWPNNNSRMYVLEGVTPCIQSMQLQAGDTVTFSRLEPENKLVMGYRRAPASLTAQVDRKRGRPLGGKSKRLRMENEDSVELKTSWEEAQELLRPPPSVVPTIVTIEGHDFEEYEEPPICSKKTFYVTRVTGEQDQWAQCDECGSWRRLPYDAVVPVRWACSDNNWDLKRASCSVPQEISSDDLEHMLGLLGGEEFAVPEKSDGPTTTGGPINAAAETSGGLDTLANAAALGDSGRSGGASPASPARTTKHPRHRPGCSCIVCIQPPSGKGPKHKQNCLCNVCVTVKRRFKTLMLRRKKRLSERETDGLGVVVRRKRKDDGEVSSVTKAVPVDGEVSSVTKAVPVDSGRPESSAGAKSIIEGSRSLEFAGATDGKKEISPLMPYRMSFGKSRSEGDITPVRGKGKIDLNIQPEREEEPLRTSGPSLGAQQQQPSSSQISMRQLLQNASIPLDTYLKQTGMKSLLAGSTPETSTAVAESSGIAAAENSGVGGGQGGGGTTSSDKKSDEHSSSHCHDHAMEEASQTSAARIAGDGASPFQIPPNNLVP